MPKTMDVMTVSCKLMSSFSAVVNYKNPFNKKVNIDIELVTDDEETWKLISKKKQIPVEPLAWVQIPINFLPMNIGKTTAELSVFISNIKWT